VPFRLAVLASGRGSNLDSLLATSAAGLLDARVTLVVSDNADAAALGKAQSAGVPAVAALVPENESRADYDDRLVELLAAESPDLIVLAGFMRILGPQLCERFAGRIINIHPALLPAFRGAHGVRDTLAAGAKLAGCTTHLVTADLDAGPIILQAALAVRPDDDEASLAKRVLRLEHQILPRTVQLFVEGRIRIQADRELVEIQPGPSWRKAPGIGLVPGALYPDAF
jgi:phosphoribosylglycinamide formyltransferase-1